MKSSWTTIACTPEERPLLAALLSRAHWQHKHVDWTNAVDLIGQQPFLLAVQDDEPIGCLACPPDPPGISWIRLVAVAPRLRIADVWDLLWTKAESLAVNAGATSAAVLLIDGWLAPFLMESGFNQTSSVVFLEWRSTSAPDMKARSGTAREFRSADLTEVVQLDNLAFEPIWRYSGPGMLTALTHASLAMVSEQEGEITGYLIVSSSALGAHIARLAVAPKWQGQGVGSALVRHAMVYAHQIGAPQLSVNTQADNVRAQGLYRSLGFLDTGRSYPVWEKHFS